MPSLTEEYPSHPFFILDHLVKNVLLERCRKNVVAAYYKAHLDDPEATIKDCRSFLADWVLETWTRGTWWKHDKFVAEVRFKSEPFLIL